jgi:hypothetical protein
MVTSTDDISLPRSERQVCRLLHDKERFILQGQDPRYCDLMCKTLARKVTGNAFPTFMLASVLIPIMREVADSGVVRSEINPLGMAELMAMCRDTKSTTPSSSSSSSSTCEAPCEAQTKKQKVQYVYAQVVVSTEWGPTNICAE